MWNPDYLKRQLLTLISRTRTNSRATFYPEITQIGDVRDQQALDQALAGFDTVVLLAAEHRDDVSPTSLIMMSTFRVYPQCAGGHGKNGVKNIIFTSSVAVYGLNKHNPDENHPHDPFQPLRQK